MPRYTSPVDFDDKQRLRRFVASPWTFVVLGVLIIAAGWNTWDMFQKWRLSEAALATTRAAHENLAAREAFLNTKITRLSMDIGIEAEMRERFGVAKEGEGVIVVLADENTVEAPLVDEGWWDRFVGWFTRD